MRFRSKLIISTIVLTLAGQAAIFAYFSRLTQNLVAERLAEKAVALASNLSRTGAHGVYDENLYRTLDPLVEGLRRDQEVISASVHDRSGAALSSFGRAADERGVAVSKNPSVRRFAAGDGWRIEAIVPVFSPVQRPQAAEEVIGAVRVELSSRTQQGRMVKAALASLALAMIIAALGVFAILFVTGRLLAPLDLIIEADEAAKRGDVEGESIPENMIPRDEIGQIIRSRAAMLTALRAAQESSEMLAQGERRRASELEKALKDLKIARDQLTHAERITLIGRLVAGVAHEINNPLTGIIGYSEMLKNDSALPEQAREDAESILQQALRCKDIVKDLSAFARKQAPTKAPADLNALVLECLKLDSHQLHTAGIRVDSDLDPGLPPVLIDRQQISQVLLNLIINARQSMRSRPEGRTLVVRTRIADGRVRMEVDDNGPGLPPENLERIFEPFFTTKSVGEGTGLGLSVSHGIVATHGGRIWVENLAAGGARFVVELPPADGQVSPAAASDGEAEPLHAPPGEAQHVIVVEDEETVRKLLCRMLKTMGMTVEAFSNGIEAHVRLRSGGFRLVISDVRMPKMNGLELYRQCRDELGDAHWIFITGSVSPETRLGLIEAGRPVLNKPFTLDELKKILADLPRDLDPG